MSLITLLGVMTFATGLLAAPSAIADPLDRLVEQYMAAHKVPGLSFEVIQNDKVKDSRYYGKANLETNTPISPESVFELASVTKPFTATAVMLLVQEGKIKLSDPITNYIDNAPPSWHQITVRELLDHTAGLPEQAIVSFNGTPLMDVSTKAQFDLIKSRPLLYTPGEKALYSDPGYFLLGMIIERVSGMKYRKFMQTRIFGPVGMTHTSILDQGRILLHRVSPYTIENGKLRRARRDWQVELPSYFGIFSTLDDLAKWDIALTEGKIVRPATLQEMWTPQKLSGGQDVTIRGKFHYGLGWLITTIKGEKVVGHDGFTGTVLLQFPNDNLTIIVLSNLDEGSGNIVPDLAIDIASHEMGDRMPASAPVVH
ncbi:MAG: serine hydrolase domain-containing protein [Steroidobacteraceae bacterium]